MSSFVLSVILMIVTPVRGLVKKYFPKAYRHLNDMAGWERMTESEALADLAERLIQLRGTTNAPRFYKSYPFTTGNFFLGSRGLSDKLKAVLQRRGYTYSTLVAARDSLSVELIEYKG